MTTSKHRVCIVLALFCCVTSSAEAGTTYPAPFDKVVNSVFGPRNFSSSPVHSGIDYLKPAGTTIPSAAAGSITRIENDSNPCGIRLYLSTVDHIVIGYCHLFTNSSAKLLTSGSFTLLKNYAFPPIPVAGLRKGAVTQKCNVILSNLDNIALVPAACYQSGRKIIYNKKTYTVVKKVSDRQAIAPVGNSGSASATSPHLHLNYGYGKDNPMVVTDHPDGIFCARLRDAGTSFSACDPVNTIPSINKNVLDSRKYIDVRIDSTDRLDLDQASFTFTTLPAQIFSLRYGGTVSTNPLVNGTSKIATYTDVSCTRTPSAGEVIICPLFWAGQAQPSSRLETVFRLGVDTTGFLPGSYQLGAALVSATGKTTNVTLPFSIGGTPTATLFVPDLQSGWTGLPASVSLTDLAVTPRVTFQINGNSPTCGTGERGSPLYSNSVPASVTFYAAKTVVGVPYQTSGPGVNRRNCSSFVAVQIVPNPADPTQTKQRIWINATGRGQQFTGSITFDWESQVRFDSGDPWTGAGRTCVGGTVPNAGFFGQAWSSQNCSVSLNF
jgi:hypothetical protein